MGSLHGSSKQVNLILLPLLLLFLFFHSSSASAHLNEEDFGDVLDRICSKTQNPAFCIQVLNSDDRIVDGKIITFAIVAVELAMANEKDTQRDLVTRLQVTKNRELAIALSTCSFMYGRSSENLRLAKLNFETHLLDRYLDVKNQTSKIQSDIDICESAVQKVPGQQGLYTQKNKNMKDLTDIVKVVADVISGSV